MIYASRDKNDSVFSFDQISTSLIKEMSKCETNKDCDDMRALANAYYLAKLTTRFHDSMVNLQGMRKLLMNV